MNIWLHEKIRLKKAMKVEVNIILQVVYGNIIPQAIKED
jgi:hypothetical protein